MANTEWYELQRRDSQKRCRTPSPVPRINQLREPTEKPLLEVLEQYVLPRQIPRPKGRPNHQQALQDAKLRACNWFQGNLHDLEYPRDSRVKPPPIEESAKFTASDAYERHVHLTTYERERDYINRPHEHSQILSRSIPDMKDSDDEAVSMKENELNDQESLKASLKNGFVMLHPSLQVAIVTEIIEEAARTQLPFHNTKVEAECGASTSMDRRMDRSFYPTELDFYPATAAPTASAIPAKPLEGRFDTLSPLVPEASLSLASPPKRRPGRPRKRETLRSPTPPLRAVSEAQAAVSQPVCEAPSSLWSDLPLHDPAIKRQKYYPADAIFGMSRQDMDALMRRHWIEYRDSQDKAPLETDIAQAEHYLHRYHLPRRWLQMWLTEDM